eukprot:9166630-Prorocentrum_lima.AAC.1
MTSSLVGSEMCIRDRFQGRHPGQEQNALCESWNKEKGFSLHQHRHHQGSVSYTHLTLPTICSV